ncbi:bifunctional 4-hydroxy-3-methylbut-2-enyl diphosphate reductase/30S ribosomal protein S1 [Sporomusa sp.]|uniref:bifunctional 4-hydroxy-3-methylbut-2-enyl diphosphate reductase/30S ribosomal protein S1 n=1 Tax=Sporomusa sp. TaxID=2078658 RepID=UPI002B585D81|nr:bifunctional 4-hydroxy-3-methylbut-2-enyl diphosphate reductase/30S ribosomal protein S1 [Sporomusa sp.]HWR45271.1 bifunctional 4-hydroxy-3-methylbut-2-enyl diphosphate reductase/30S ribosomal protein S1 [Sporomusa sp.]
MKIYLAEHRGFCYGVKRAIDIALNAADTNCPVHTLGPIIHNPQMVSYLKEQGIGAADRLEEISTGKVIIRSHGVGPEIYRQAEVKQLDVVDATCPHVKKAQQAAYALLTAGYQVVIVGERHHPEVQSILAWTSHEADVVETPSEAEALPFHSRLGVVAQTTFAAEDFEAIVTVLRFKCEELKIERTICTATDLRQQAAVDLAKKVDIMIVVGGKNSANTTRLASVCRDAGSQAYHIESANELKPEWFAGVQTVGMTAGASTPDWVIEEVYRKMEEMNITDVVKLDVGSIVKGTIVGVRHDEVFVDIGYKAEGVIPLSELAYPAPQTAADAVSVGQVIEVLVLDADSADGQVKLSKVQADKLTAWDKLEQAFTAKQPVDAKITEVVKGGVVAAVFGVRGFIPASQVDIRFVETLEPFVGQTVQAVPIEIDREKQKAVLSRRQLLSLEKEVKEKELFAKLAVGQTITGKVSRLANFGAFVDIGGIDGLVHISDLSWQRVKTPQEVVNVGDEVTVVVLKVDTEAKKLSLSLKDVERDPWYTDVDTLTIGSIVSGAVSKIAKFGAFVEIKKGIEGLVHISEMAERRVANPEEVVATGQQVAVKILSIDKENKRVGLSMVQAEQDKERAEFSDYLTTQAPSSGVTLGDKFGHLFKRED